MKSRLKTKRTFPWTDEVGGHRITIRPMTPDDRDLVNTFTQGLSHEDVMFLQMDITQPEVIEGWIEMITRGDAIVLIALDKTGQVIGYVSLYSNSISWNRHQGEIRVFVLKSLRGSGIGKRLATEVAHIADEQDLDMIVVNIPREQPHVRQMMERIGFQVDALLTDWLIDLQNQTHDVIVMSKRLRDY